MLCALANEVTQKIQKDKQTDIKQIYIKGHIFNALEKLMLHFYFFFSTCLSIYFYYLIYYFYYLFVKLFVH